MNHEVKITINLRVIQQGIEYLEAAKREKNFDYIDIGSSIIQREIDRAVRENGK